MQQLRQSLTLFTAFSCLACGGLKATICVSSPKENLNHCYDYDKKVFETKTYAEIDNWVGESPSDFQNEVEACKRGSSGPAINACVMSSSEMLLHCYNEATQKFNQIPVSETENFVLETARDKQNMLDYCKTIHQ